MFTSCHPAAETEEEARVTPYYKASDSKGSASQIRKLQMKVLKVWKSLTLIQMC
jgi:hypothetical protein